MNEPIVTVKIIEAIVSGILALGGLTIAVIYAIKRNKGGK
jgi:hypothetical protein